MVAYRRIQLLLCDPRWVIWKPPPGWAGEEMAGILQENKSALGLVMPLPRSLHSSPYHRGGCHPRVSTKTGVSPPSWRYKGSHPSESKMKPCQGRGSLQEVRKLCFRSERQVMSKMGCGFQKRALEAIFEAGRGQWSTSKETGNCHGRTR